VFSWGKAKKGQQSTEEWDRACDPMSRHCHANKRPSRDPTSLFRGDCPPFTVHVDQEDFDDNAGAVQHLTVLAHFWSQASAKAAP